MRLEPDGNGTAEAAPIPLTDTTRAELRRAGQPLSRQTLRERLRVNNERLGHALRSLGARGLIRREANGWSLTQQPRHP